MFTEEFLATMEKEGVAPIVTWNEKEPNLAATWNSYIQKSGNNTLLIPVQGMLTAQDNVAHNNKVRMVIGSKEVQGKFGPGAGFLLEGTAAFIREGEQLATMQERFPWANCVLEVSVEKITQTV